MWTALDSPEPFGVMELGAGSGLLGDDIVAFANSLDPAFAFALAYQRVDRASPEFIGEESGQPIHCILSNELLDAFPVHLLQIANGTIREKFVALKGDRLEFQLGDVSDPEIAARIEPYLSELPDGYESEVCLGHAKWAEQLNAKIASGYVMSIDYGYTRDALYAPRRSLGTLQCHYRHTIAPDPLVRIGEQDISAHVDFTAVDEAMAASGFKAIANVSQAELLEHSGIDRYLERLIVAGLPQQDVQPNQYALRALIEPEGLGRFRVAIHAKNAPAFGVPGIAAPTAGLFDEAVLPALDDDPRRVNLFAGAYGSGDQSMGTWGELCGE
jgi:SAM-dependent MidA family methyltransferase